MEHPAKLAAALVAFQGAVPVIPKNKTANIPTKSGGKYSYSYADLADMWEAIRTPLKNNGLAVTQALVGGSSGWLGIKTTVWHQSGEHISDTVELNIDRCNAQEVGSQITYFKRYALAAILGISTEEDDDGNAASAPKRPQAATPSSPLSEAKAELKLAIRQAKASPEDFTWVRDETDVEKIKGATAALKLGKAVTV